MLVVVVAAAVAAQPQGSPAALLGAVKLMHDRSCVAPRRESRWLGIVVVVNVVIALVAREKNRSVDVARAIRMPPASNCL